MESLTSVSAAPRATPIENPVGEPVDLPRRKAQRLRRSMYLQGNISDGDRNDLEVAHGLLNPDIEGLGETVA